MESKEILAYKVGALLYAPAVYTGIPEKLLTDKFLSLSSVALCLEDSIQDHAVEQAEKELYKTVKLIGQNADELGKRKNDMPLIFVRIRTPDHMRKIYGELRKTPGAITGFILPKFDLPNASGYLNILKEINSERMHDPIYIMPILESESIAYKETRLETLVKLKSLLDQIAEYVLNIRVGGNDFCNIFGLRRAVGQTIYEMGVIKDILFDILNVFARDYVVSAPVWEYFDDGTSKDWQAGLEREVALDRLNGFIGKTAIHPSQLPVISNGLKVCSDDYRDALQILNWAAPKLAVSKSDNGRRMNEVKVHEAWARKTKNLAQIYGIVEDGG